MRIHLAGSALGFALASLLLAQHSARAAVSAAAIRRADLLDLGRAPATLPVEVAFTLRYRNQAELDRLVRLQADPRSPLFRHFLQPAQFAAEFAPAPADYARVAVTLQRAGFRITQVYSNRTLLDAVAAAPVAERFFGTEIHRVAQAGHGVRYANVVAATLPAALGAYVRSFAGVDDLVKVRTMNVPAEDYPAGGAAAADASPDLAGPIERKSGGAFAGLYPTGIAKAYHFPTQFGYNGVGQAIGIVIDSDIADSDLQTFWAAAKIDRTGAFGRYLIGKTDPGVTSDVDETAIDVEMAASLAPAAAVYLYLPVSLDDTPIENAYNKIVNDDVVNVASSSFGGCEYSDTPFADATDAIAEQGAALGITFTASTGDSGGFCNFGSALAADIVNSPASGPYFVAVGGTTLKIGTTGARTSETAWSPGGASGGGGGGVSSYFPLPTYQSATPGMTVVPTIVAKSGNPQPNSGFAGRNVPDISLDASNKTGSYQAVYFQGAWHGYGGTSVSNPMFAAYIADLNEEHGSSAGFINPYLYTAFSNNGYGTYFYDVTSGSIGAGWTAAPGYDQATGIGTINNTFP